MSAKWLAITGMDGSGKTTLKKNLVEYLVRNSLNVQDFKLPYDKYLLSLLDVSGGGKAFVDNYTDRLIFSLDNRIVSNHITKWKREYDLLISQRCFFDSFVFGVVQGFTYDEVEKINRMSELETCDIMIHLNADYKVAYDRIKNDPKGDKFETLEHMELQYFETQKAYYELISGQNIAMESFRKCENIYIDTTYLTTRETFDKAYYELTKIINFEDI